MSTFYWPELLLLLIAFFFGVVFLFVTVAIGVFAFVRVAEFLFRRWG